VRDERGEGMEGTYAEFGLGGDGEDEERYCCESSFGKGAVHLVGGFEMGILKKTSVLWETLKKVASSWDVVSL
jgi:hypothetical protein